jgi:hypothetical protein
MAPSKLPDNSEEIDNVAPADAVAPGQGDNPLPIAVPEQDKEEWCWAAVCVGLRAFYNHEQLEQCAIATEVIGGDCCANPEMCDKPQFISVVLQDMHYSDGAKKNQVGFDVIRTQIDKRRPICCFIKHESDVKDVGHVIVISGYDLQSKQVGVLDPATNGPHDSTQLIPFESFRISYNGGTWTETILTHPKA